MKSKWGIGFMAGLLAFGVVAAAPVKTPAKSPLEVAKGQALTVHQSLIADANSQVRAKIAASAQAARECLVRNPQSCNLHEFLTRDLQKRFPRLTEEQLNVLMTLAFAETLSDMSQQDQLALQDALQRQAQVMQTISNISKNEHDTLLAIIQNLKG
jgi:hypothetical protein